MQLILGDKTVLTIVAALGYGLATVLMKTLSDQSNLILPVMLAMVLIITVLAEIALLRKVDLGMAYVAIIATESLLVFAYAYWVGEGLSSREWMGAGFVITGAALVSY
ncbi:5-aminolevulinate synthase [Pararhodobacter sp.]|uniref:5-aminolevulinate synthase n=1 Tax=Pararhodobacter sp. TaxID=2127056 RepID=UPI002AFF4038|nr:5-aminolevulinate synthase [Pararhodobacter sp.]